MIGTGELTRKGGSPQAKAASGVVADAMRVYDTEISATNDLPLSGAAVGNTSRRPTRAEEGRLVGGTAGAR